MAIENLKTNYKAQK